MKIFGHEKIEQELAQAIISGRVFPTWIFSGPFGVGKAGMAIKFAKCLLSGEVPSAKNLDISDDHRVHRLVDLRIHPDFFILEQSDSSVSINDTRELLQKIHSKPIMSAWRVVILENASNLNKNIYNSLLKILEEPPKNTVIIMICQNTGNIPRTLLSRACKMSFSPLPTEQVRSILESKGISNASELAAMSNGSVGYALYLQERNGIEIFNLLQKAFSTGDKKALQKIIDNNMTGDFRIIKESLLGIFRKYMEHLIELADERNDVFSKAPFEKDIDAKIKKIIEIISMINKSEPLMLDKQVVLAYAFEKFFDL